MKMTSIHYKNLETAIQDFTSIKTPEFLANYKKTLEHDSRIKDLECETM